MYNNESSDEHDHANDGASGIYETAVWLIAISICLAFWGAIAGLALRALGYPL
ncbi:MAG: hypothetical protein ACRES4_06535 [Nevskiales bacterium]